MELYSFLMTDDAEREKDNAWTNLWRESGWVCRICGAVPNTGSSSRTTFATTAARLLGTNRLTFDTAGGIIIFVERIAVYPHM